MKSYFAINQNPDAKDLKNLAQKTGLSKRVLQVWFQNARAKFRRTVMRQEQQHNGCPMNGKSVMGLMLPNISSLGSSIMAENCHLIRGGLGNDNDLPTVESSPSQSSSLDDINQMTFAELY